MRKVAHLLQRKGANIISVEPGLPVLQALQLMADKNIGSVMVMENDEYLGVMTERDYARKVILKGKASAETLVKDIMSTGLPRITPDNSIETCMHIMSESNIRYLPVFDNDHVCGIISITDVVTETILSQKETIEQLQNYIQS
ncbi:CBS domain-containing protein [Lacibacter luteus]|uniref:CBS domain-containing protein n=1 Tax=Lacibacter luteus TaxID=2508719 RepID=A0A4Q1CEQ2_9BACT|nr:CBS domain-containing protein [Lacibacter luteus]RXK58368.1 CBS domain-containing protein [Lacibacter luteus]